MLPRYTKQYDPEDPGDPEWNADSDPLLDKSNHQAATEAAPPVYPPSSSSTLPVSPEGRHSVEYMYTPVFPRLGEVQYAVGVLGKTKQVSSTKGAANVPVGSQFALPLFPHSHLTSVHAYPRDQD